MICQLRGLISNGLWTLFQDCEFSMRVSYLELYNEELFDLLGSTECDMKMRIYDDSTKKVCQILPYSCSETPQNGTQALMSNKSRCF